MAWLTGWTYRKSHTISGSAAGVQTNYQMRIDVHRASGSDSGQEVYVDTKCEADFGDIRFTKADGSTLLDYWLKEDDGTEAIFWVEIDSIPASPSTVDIYIYYGKSGQATTSSGTNTFPVFDDFDDNSIDADWNQVDLTGTPDWTETGQNFGADDPWSGPDYSSRTYQYRDDVSFTTCVIEAETMIVTEDYHATRDVRNQGLIARETGGGNYYTAGVSYRDDEYDIRRSSMTMTKSSFNMVYDTYYDFAFIPTDDAQVLYINDAQIDTDTWSYTGAIYGGVWEQESHARWNNFRIREHCDPEPAHSTWGSEESEAATAIQLLVDGGVIQLLVDGGTIQKIVD